MGLVKEHTADHTAQSRHTEAHKHRQLVLDKGVKAAQWSEDSSTTGAEAAGYY